MCMCVRCVCVWGVYEWGAVCICESGKVGPPCGPQMPAMTQVLPDPPQDKSAGRGESCWLSQMKAVLSPFSTEMRQGKVLSRINRWAPRGQL